MNENLKAIVYKRKTKTLSHICKVALITFNMVLLSVISNFYLLIDRLKESDYHSANMYDSSQIDPFIGEKIDLIINVFTIMSVFVLISSLVLIVALSIFWLKKIKSEYKVHSFLGYSKWQVKKWVMIDNVIEYVVSIPLCLILSLGTWQLVVENDMLKQIFMEIDQWKNFDMRIFPVVMGIVIIMAVVEAVF